MLRPKFGESAVKNRDQAAKLLGISRGSLQYANCQKKMPISFEISLIFGNWEYRAFTNMGKYFWRWVYKIKNNPEIQFLSD